MHWVLLIIRDIYISFFLLFSHQRRRVGCLARWATRRSAASWASSLIWSRIMNLFGTSSLRRNSTKFTPSTLWGSRWVLSLKCRMVVSECTAKELLKLFWRSKFCGFIAVLFQNGEHSDTNKTYVGILVFGIFYLQ